MGSYWVESTALNVVVVLVTTLNGSGLRHGKIQVVPLGVGERVGELSLRTKQVVTTGALGGGTTVGLDAVCCYAVEGGFCPQPSMVKLCTFPAVFACGGGGAS